jgi:phosphoenolpyruvate carboxylase
LGSALASLANEAPEAFERLRQHLLTWAPLHFAISNAATAIAWTCPDTMARYAALSTDATHAPALLRAILDEHARTYRMLEALYGGPLAERRPLVHADVSARREALAVLHARQIALLARYRGGEPELLSELLLTVNSLAMGLGGTG